MEKVCIEISLFIRRSNHLTTVYRFVCKVTWTWLMSKYGKQLSTQERYKSDIVQICRKMDTALNTPKRHWIHDSYRKWDVNPWSIRLYPGYKNRIQEDSDGLVRAKAAWSNTQHITIYFTDSKSRRQKNERRDHWRHRTDNIRTILRSHLSPHLASTIVCTLSQRERAFSSVITNTTRLWQLFG